MKKLMRIPFYIPFLGIIISFILFFIVASVPNTTLLVTGVVLLHLSGWLLIARFFLCTTGFFSIVLMPKQ
jgi:hypothetical protein